MRLVRWMVSAILPLTAACAPGLHLGLAGANRVQVSSLSQHQPVLRGQVRLPKGFGVQYTSTDILGNATVSLRDAGGVVRLAGTTDATGAFALYRPTTAYALVDGATYQLEILKRLTANSTDKSVSSLKTYLKRQGDGWQSIAMQGSAVVVNLQTTALSYWVDDGQMTATQVIGGLTGANLDTLAPAIAALPNATTDFDRRVASMTFLLLIGKDPVGTRNFTRDSSVTLTNAATVAEAGYLTEISGDLTIESATLTTLSLPLLTTVTGQLQIRNCPNLTSVSLPALTTAGNGIQISDCPLMTQLPSLGALTSITTNGLTLENMAGLTAVTGAANLQTLERLTLINCPALTNLTGLTSLQAASLTLQGNTALTSLNGLTALRTCPSLSIGDSPNLVSLAPLAGVTGQMQIRLSGCGLTDLTGLDGVTASDQIMLSQLNALTSLTGLGALTTVRTLDLKSIPQLTSLAGLGALTAIQDRVSIDDCSAFNSLAGAGALTAINNLQLMHSAVTSLLPLHALTSLASASFSDNAQLTDGCINALQAVFPATRINSTGNNVSLTCP